MEQRVYSRIASCTLFKFRACTEGWLARDGPELGKTGGALKAVCLAMSLHLVRERFANACQRRRQCSPVIHNCAEPRTAAEYQGVWP